MSIKKLIVFVKNPELGKAKTRLAVTIGNEEALKVYKQLLLYTNLAVKELTVNKEVQYSSFIDKEDIWENDLFAKVIQKGENLGSKMSNAFARGFSLNSNSHIILIGSDCAELEKEIILEAYQELITHDVVLGPAEDGGYYLIGMSKFIPELFEGIEWSTNEVLNQTIEKITTSNLNYAKLRALNDVDDVGDYEQIKHKLPSL